MRGQSCESRRVFCAQTEAIEQFCLEVRTFCTKMSRNLAFPVELLLREALGNAVAHGCRNDPAKRIFCALRAKTGRLLIVVRDEGEGFDWRALPLQPSAVDVSGGRGIEILRKYATRVRFNAKGNLVALLMRFREETGE